jgi:hypothetical protein
MESLLLEGCQNGFNGFLVYSIQGCNFFIWATVIFRLAGMGVGKFGHKKGEITHNLGFYYIGKIP